MTLWVVSITSECILVDGLGKVKYCVFWKEFWLLWMSLDRHMVILILRILWLMIKGILLYLIMGIWKITIVSRIIRKNMGLRVRIYLWIRNSCKHLILMVCYLRRVKLIIIITFRRGIYIRWDLFVCSWLGCRILTRFMILIIIRLILVLFLIIFRNLRKKRFIRISYLNLYLTCYRKMKVIDIQYRKYNCC
jgi:hypothetical protein